MNRQYIFWGAVAVLAVSSLLFILNFTFQSLIPFLSGIMFGGAVAVLVYLLMPVAKAQTEHFTYFSGKWGDGLYLVETEDIDDTRSDGYGVQMDVQPAELTPSDGYNPVGRYYDDNGQTVAHIYRDPMQEKLIIAYFDQGRVVIEDKDGSPLNEQYAYEINF